MYNQNFKPTCDCGLITENRLMNYIIARPRAIILQRKIGLCSTR